MSKFKLTTSG